MGGLQNGPECVNSWLHRTFRSKVTALLRECIEPLEAEFVNAFERLEQHNVEDFAKLQAILPFNSSVGAPLSQRLLVESGGPLSWWTTLVEEIGPSFTASMKINNKHKGFKEMVTAAKKMDLQFEDVYLPGADSPDGTWKGITEKHSYEFVFLCFMNAYAKKVVDERFHSKMEAMFPDESVRKRGPVKSLQRCNEKNASLPKLETLDALASLKLPRCAGLLDLNRVSLTFGTIQELLEAHGNIMAEGDLLVTNMGRLKNGFLKSNSRKGYRDLKINAVLKGTGMLCEVQLSLKEFVAINEASHPYYELWRVLSEWCTESEIGKRGKFTLKNALELYEEGKNTSTKGEREVALSPAAGRGGNKGPLFVPSTLRPDSLQLVGGAEERVAGRAGGEGGMLESRPATLAVLGAPPTSVQPEFGATWSK